MMGQVSNGIRAILSSPIVYDALQNIMGADQFRKNLVNEFIKPDSGCRILDLGCGTAEILKYLPEDINYWGFDISPDYIGAAKRRYGERGHFQCGLLDKSSLSALPKFDRVLSLGVLHHLNDDEVKGFLSLSSSALDVDGRFISFDPCLATDQNPIARFLISKDRGQNVRDAEGYLALAHGVFKDVKGTLRHKKWIPYTHWFMEGTQ